MKRRPSECCCRAARRYRRWTPLLTGGVKGFTLAAETGKGLGYIGEGETIIQIGDA